MKRLTKDKVCYAMSHDNPPCLRVQAGERFRLEVSDCYSGNLKTPDDVFTKDMWSTVNPATGPVFVDGAQPGDILRIDVASIEIGDHAVMCVEHGAGALADCVNGAETTILPIRNGAIELRDGVALPVRPMIGVLGVAPAGEPILNGTPGEHGANMDCKEIGAGASVCLPVLVPGALLAAGDLHALMGDGEVCICGAEVAGEVELCCTILRSSLPTPCVETADALLFLSSAVSLDDCERAVLGKAHRFLHADLGLPANESARVMSLVGGLCVCQVVNPLKTMKFVLPKPLLRSLAGERLDDVLTGL